MHQGKDDILTHTAFGRILEVFSRFGHRPSRDMLMALHQLIESLTAMAEGRAEARYYLCSVDPGVGKSTAIIQWLKTYLEDIGDYRDAGVLIVVERYDEIERFIRDSGVGSDDYAVSVTDSKTDLNRLGIGKDEADTARVLLFTTKAQIRLRSQGRPFRKASQFFYKGRVRAVKIWDESLLLGKTLTLDRAEIGGLLSTIARKNIRLMEQIERLMAEILTLEDGAAYQLPAFDVSLNEALHTFNWSTADRKNTAETLWLMSGQVVTVRKDNRGQTLLDCVEDIPEDFPPCVVTDASVRLRETYRLQEKHRGNVYNLKQARKGYDDLTFRVWRHASGKHTYMSKKIHDITEQVVRVIDDRPEEEFLVIDHKPAKSGDNNIETLIKREMKTDAGRVKFIHYGQHTSTNLYAHIPNIIVAGTLFYRVADYEALGRASANRPTSKGNFTDDEIDRMKKGESAHHLLQAVCRGKVRMCEGHRCPKSTVWLIADIRTGIEQMLPTIFPGCRVKSWNVSQGELKKNLKKAYEFIRAGIEAGNHRIPARDVRREVGIEDSYKFRRDILGKVEFQQALEHLGVIVEGSGRAMTFLKPDFDYYFGNAAAMNQK